MSRSDRYIQHITLTTGDTRRSYRDEVADEVVEALSTTLLPEALVERDPGEFGPQIPGMTLYLAAVARGRCGLVASVVMPLTEGSDRPFVPVLIFGVAAEARCSRKVWDLLHMPGSYYVTDPETPPAPPWCAARLESVASILGRQTLMMLGDFERCLAWAWLGRQ
jgi:hypothetical protein